MTFPSIFIYEPLVSLKRNCPTFEAQPETNNYNLRNLDKINIPKHSMHVVYSAGALLNGMARLYYIRANKPFGKIKQNNSNPGFIELIDAFHTPLCRCHEMQWIDSSFTGIRAGLHCCIC